MEKYRTVIILGAIASVIALIGFLSLKSLDLIFGPFDNPIKKNNGTGCPGMIYSMTWDFNSGDLSGLTVYNVEFKKDFDNGGFYLDFHNFLLSSNTLILNKKVVAPWRLSFNGYLYYRNKIRFSFTNKKSSFKIKVYKKKFYFIENKTEHVEDSFPVLTRWAKWVIDVSADGKLDVSIDGKPYFNHVFLDFKPDLPTEIRFYSPSSNTFWLDNLKIGIYRAVKENREKFKKIPLYIAIHPYFL